MTSRKEQLAVRASFSLPGVRQRIVNERNAMSQCYCNSCVRKGLTKPVSRQTRNRHKRKAEEELQLEDEVDPDSRLTLPPINEAVSMFDDDDDPVLDDLDEDEIKYPEPKPDSSDSSDGNPSDHDDDATDDKEDYIRRYAKELIELLTLGDITEIALEKCCKIFNRLVCDLQRQFICSSPFVLLLKFNSYIYTRATKHRTST